MNSIALRTPPTSEQAAAYLEEAKNVAAAGLVIVAHRIADTVSDPNPANPLTHKQILEYGDHLYKLSGLASKQQAAATAPFKINFNFNKTPDGKQSVGITVENEPDLLPEAPNMPLLFPVTEDLVALVDE